MRHASLRNAMPVMHVCMHMQLICNRSASAQKLKFERDASCLLHLDLYSEMLIMTGTMGPEGRYIHRTRSAFSHQISSSSENLNSSTSG